jgi:hypothetical protein
MELTTLLQDIHRLNHELERFERKYGVMSQTFYEMYLSGEEPADDAWVLDFEKWAGLYEVWRDRNITRIAPETLAETEAMAQAALRAAGRPA